MPPVPERGHGVTLGSSDVDGEGAIDLDRLTAEEDVGDVTDVSSPDSHGNTMVFNKLELDVFKGDKKHKKAPYNFRVVFHFAPVAQPGVDAAGAVEGAAAGSDVHVDLDAPTSEALVRNAVGPRVDDGVLTAL